MGFWFGIRGHTTDFGTEDKADGYIKISATSVRIRRMKNMANQTKKEKWGSTGFLPVTEDKRLRIPHFAKNDKTTSKPITTKIKPAIPRNQT